ncbi:Carbonic anhydrase or acetyltransferase, isoleucine patch superfamily [Desulfatibacillum alkenivorans DSM 16219]|jgi:carbonic anhydrase/acetyltransferase-like protein (isoleucine patch superfamily)|uniref:Carbonic anhydrase or acetyltransferase, isoleucine patch superfamily n=1 Tax=Desulfatibacillum alkenivorans DSM 16219 TaxID=1121393 RepID=A0A1M6Y1X9_9BACT|nr:gamma carbonic anhydrase family protein [Desulfatibacillum alkenivorans]SHL12217.1 Carbonic anhydrase or acetyltransferase, isoleucine patch superfamily [Desulfatibacillum alkenivorans DSM 16219]
MAEIHPSVFVAPNVFVSGDVTVDEDSSLWPGASLRGDLAPIRIGKGSSIQDNTSLHVNPGFKLEVGDLVTVGHGAVLHGCKIGNHSVVGMNSTVLDGAEIGDCCLVAAGSVVKGGTKVPDYSLVAGNPAEIKSVRLKPFMNWVGALMYVAISSLYKQGATEFPPDELNKIVDSLKDKYPMPPE